MSKYVKYLQFIRWTLKNHLGTDKEFLTTLVRLQKNTTNSIYCNDFF